VKVLEKIVVTQLSAYLEGPNFSVLISVLIVEKNQLNNCLWWLLIVLFKHNMSVCVGHLTHWTTLSSKEIKSSWSMQN